MNHPPPAVPAVAAPVDAALDLESAVVSDLVRALCQAAGRPRFAMSPDVVALQKRVTVALAGSRDQVWKDGVAALDLAGVNARCVDGLCKFFVPAPVGSEKKEPVSSVLSYAPVHRNVAFLASSLASMFPGWHFAGGTVGGAGGAAGAVAVAVSPASGSGGGGSAVSGRAEPQEAVAVRLVGLGPVEDRGKVLAALGEIDREVASMLVHLAVYEVATSSSDRSAIAVVGKVLGATVQVGGSVAAGLASSSLASLSIKAGGWSAVVAALDSSSVAHLVTSPVLRTSSGVLSSFAVGDSVPTLGSVSYSQGSSTPIQSIQYQQSGVVFSVLPVLVGDKVDVALFQSISSFTETTTGVTSSPTLQNRVLSSDLVVRPGAVVVLGGLMQTNDTKGTTGWWVVPDLVKSNNHSKTEMVLVLSVDVDQS